MADRAELAGDEKVVFQGKLVEVVQQPMRIGTKTMTFEKARRAPGIRLVVFSEDGRKLLLTREYRYETEDYDYRLPGGKVFDSLEEYNAFLSSGKDILVPATQKAVDEGHEEAGLVIEKLHHIHTSLCGATVQWDLLYFMVDSWHESQAGQRLESGEDISVEWVDFKRAQAMALDGSISEERSALIVLRQLQVDA